jgi:hypothetical protein
VSGLGPVSERSAAAAIGATTLASGAALVVRPALVLRLLGARTPEPAPLLFRIVGMFMGVAGGLLVDASRQDPPPLVALRWSLAQKVGATSAMALGVRAGHYRRQALAVAAFDGLSVVVLAVLLASRRRPSP